MVKPVLMSVAAGVLFIGSGWALRNELAARRNGDWVSVKRGDLATGVDVSGALASAEGGLFGPPQLTDVYEFKIAMMAPEGSEVRVGDPVVAFDTSELRKRLEENSAEAEQARKEIEKRSADLRLQLEDEKLKLAESKAKLRKTELKLDTPPDIIGINERKQVEIDRRLAEREVAAIGTRIGQLESAAAAGIGLLESKERAALAIVASTKAAIAQLTIRAPRAGTVAYVPNSRGEKKKVGDTCWRAERIVEIPDLNHLVANADVDEVDAGKVALGQRASLRLDARPDDELHGTITAVGHTVEQQENTGDAAKVLHVRIALDRCDPSYMRPGMRFQGLIELARAKNVIVAPREALFTTAEGPTMIRRGLLGAETVHPRIGKGNDKLVEIVEGLRPGDRVLLPKNRGKKETS